MPNDKLGVTPAGFVPKRLDQIKSDIYEKLKKGWGIDPTINPQSLLSVLVTSFSDEVAALWEIGQDNYNSMYPSTAEGVSLDNALQFGGVTRRQKARTTYNIKCTGRDGTEVPAGTLVRATTQPVKEFITSRRQYISRDTFRSIRLRAVAGEDLAIYTVAINNGTYVYEPKSGDTEAEILSGIQGAITDDSVSVEVQSRTTEGQEIKELFIEAVNKQSSNTLVISENILVTECCCNLTFESVDYGEVSVPNGTITEIVTITPGLESVVNDISPILGQLQEDDIKARQSYIQRIAVRSRSMLESIAAYLYDNVQGVKSVKPYENDTDVTDADGRPPHSIEVVVDGGSESEVAQGIMVSKTNGIQTFGEITISIADSDGNIHPIRFNRPKYLYAWLRVTLTRNPRESIAPNYAARTKDAIMGKAAEFNVGESIFTQKFLADIYANVTGVSFVAIKAYSTESASESPAEYPLDNIEVSPRQKAVFSVDRIEVNLVGN